MVRAAMKAHDKAIIWAMVVGAIAGAILGLVRPYGIHEPPPEQSPRRESVSPPVSPLLTGAHAESAYVAVKESCRTPGHGRVAYCWWEGWAFARKAICIDSSIAGAPLTSVAGQFNGIGGLRVIVGGTRVGTCAAKGYGVSQRVSFLSMSKSGAARYNYQVCGVTAPANYGNLTQVGVAIYVTGPQRTPCGGGAEWTDVFAHELGHALGLTHDQKAATSIMRDGHRPDASDRSNLVILYGNKRL